MPALAGTGVDDVSSSFNMLPLATFLRLLFAAVPNPIQSLYKLYRKTLFHSLLEHHYYCCCSDYLTLSALGNSALLRHSHPAFAIIQPCYSGFLYA